MAKYDHGGGCACGLSRFCDCSRATAQDRKDRKEYDRIYGKKEKPKMAGFTDHIDQRDFRDPPPNNAAHPRTPFRGHRAFDLAYPDAKDAALAFLAMTGGRMDQNPSTGSHVVVFQAETAEQRDYLEKEWKLGMPASPALPTAKIEFEKEEVVFLSVVLDNFLDQVKKAMPDVALPPVADAVQKKIAMFKKEMDE